MTDQCGVTLGLPALVQYRAAFGRIICGIDNVLYADRQSMQCPERQAAFTEFIGGASLLQCHLAIQMRPGANRRFELIDVREAGFDQFTGR